jgi:hypothetical protein
MRTGISAKVFDRFVLDRIPTHRSAFEREGHVDSLEGSLEARAARRE